MIYPGMLSSRIARVSPTPGLFPVIKVQVSEFRI